MIAHSTGFLIRTKSSAAADQIVTDVGAGSLWGVSMGTTSEAASYSNRAIVTATSNRMTDLEDAAPEDVELLLTIAGVEAFSNRSDSAQFWCLLGIAEEL